MKVNYIIVGQGIAGTLLAHFLLKAGKTVKLIDKQHEGAASKVAAGIINPVTGRRIVKSWRIDELLPFAEQTYQEIEKQFDIEIFIQKNIIRSFENNKQFTDWSVKSAREGMTQYMSDDYEGTALNGWIKSPYAWGEILQSGRVDVPLLIDNYRNRFVEKGILEEADFDYKQIDFSEDLVSYKSIQADKIIFCEGWQSAFNPYFSYLPHEAAKGEMLIVRIPNIKLDKLIKMGVFIVPIGEERYWIGSTYSWDDLNDTPTEEARQDLCKRLEKVLQVPYEVLEHHAAVRPVFKDRRPIIGLHPNFSQLAIFNGMGTKGASITPFWAHHFSDFLCEYSPLDDEVNVNRIIPTT